MSEAAVTPGRVPPAVAVRGWLLAGSVYFLAVFHRSSLGVAGLIAERRFGIGSGQLSVFVLLQIGVYAAMQIPTGVLVDRYGPRRLLLVATTVMGCAQLLFALAPSYPVALLARAALGCGDAMTFISVLRYAARYFSPARYPLIVTLTGTLGVVGNLLATLPLALLLRGWGWRNSFLAAGAASLLAGAVLVTFLRDETPRPGALSSAAQVRQGVAAVTRRVATAWSLPGTRLGFWVHFACMATSTSLGVLWGHPYLVEGVGLTDTEASAVLLGGVLVSGICGPLTGWLIGRRPFLRVPLALGVCAVSIVGWALVIGVLGDHPDPAAACAVFIVSMVGSPVSGIAFAVTRDYNHARTLGTASGAVNVGGFVAAVVITLSFGWTLTALGGPSAHTYRLAMLVMIVVQGFGTWRLATWYRRVRADVRRRQALGEVVPVRVERVRWFDLPVAPVSTEARAP